MNILQQYASDLYKQESLVPTKLVRAVRTANPALKNMVRQIARGYEGFCENKTTENDYFNLMRALYVQTQGDFDRIVSELMADCFPTTPSSDYASDLFPETSKGDVEDVVKKIDEDGVYIFDELLPEDYVSRLRDSILSYKPYGDLFEDYSGTLADPKPAGHPRYAAGLNDLINTEDLWRLIKDPFIFEVCERYLGCRHICDFAGATNSFPGHTSGEALSRAAQNVSF